MLYDTKASTTHRRLDVILEDTISWVFQPKLLIFLESADNRSRTYDLRITNAKKQSFIFIH